jgi:K+-transporting ATPase ATPase C chain
VLTILLGVVYPLLVTGVSQVAFPGNADGQKVCVSRRLVGSKIIGQDSVLLPVRAVGDVRQETVARLAYGATKPASQLTRGDVVVVEAAS